MPAWFSSPWRTRLRERRDVVPVLNWIHEQPELTRLPVILLRYSMGVATAIRTAAERPDVGHKRRGGSRLMDERILGFVEEVAASR